MSMTCFKMNFFPDVYVKVYLLVNGKRVKKKKTNRKEINNPVWNEALSFSLPSANLQEASIEVYLTFTYLFNI